MGQEQPPRQAPMLDICKLLSLRKAHRGPPAGTLEAAPGSPLETAVEGSQRSPARYAAQSVHEAAAALEQVRNPQG